MHSGTPPRDAGLAGDFDQPGVVGERTDALCRLLRIQSGVEPAERIRRLLGHAVGGVGRARRVAVTLTIQDGDHVVVGGDRPGVDQLADRRAELLLEVAARRAEEVLVERQHGLRLVGAFLLDQVARRHPDRLGLASCRLVLFRHDDVEHQRHGEDHHDGGQADLDRAGCACGRRPSGRIWRSSSVCSPRDKSTGGVSAPCHVRRQMGPQRRDRFRRGGRAAAPQREKVGEAVYQRTELAVVDRHACRAHGVRVLPAFVAKRVEPGRQHQRRRQSGQVVGQQRRYPWVGRVDRARRRGTCRGTTRYRAW